MLSSLLQKTLLMGLGLTALVLVAAGIESQGETTAFFQAAARLSGRVSLIYFSVLVIYATLNMGFDQSASYFSTKYRLFRDFAILHIIHWFLLAVAVYRTGFELLPIRVAGGALAYALIVGMPFMIQRYVASKPMLLAGLQGFYMFWVWLVFTMTYTARLTGGSPTNTGSPAAWWPLLVWLVLLIFWRAWMLLARLKRQR